METKLTSELPPLPVDTNGPISDEAVDLVWASAIFSVLPAFTVLGVVTNLLNLAVFSRLGLTNAVNICFFALSLSDFCCLAVYFFVLVTAYIQRVSPNSFINLPDLSNVATWYYRMFYDISTVVTTFIAVQRGCCVVLPFHLRNIFTKERVVAIIIFIYVSGMACYVPVLAMSPLLPVRDSQTNATQVKLVFSPGRDEVVVVEDILKKFALTFTGEFIAILSLMAIIIGIRSASQFRETASHSGLILNDNGETNHRVDVKLQRTDKAPRISKGQQKEYKIVRQVVIITMLFIVCNTPQMIASIVGRVVPGVDLYGYNRNLFFLTYTVVNIFELFNCAINFFIYYKFNTKFKDIVDEAMCS